ncbi:C40 family peptidase, partial [Aquipuribacter hungaricus]|uniref:C40 family peptidase n=1 Tax=Aquipuribacter hungaricus TaxID=545624 RepID=UPI0036083962
ADAGSTAPAGTRAAAPAGAAAGAPAAGQAPAASAGTMSCGGVSVDVPTDRVATVLAFACSQLGKPYVWGASGPNAYDCSGFTMASWAKAGVSLPHSSRSQAGVGTRVSEGDLRAGDLVFSFSPISHVGIYLGGGKMIAAPSAGDVVKIQSLQYLPYTAGTRL